MKPNTLLTSAALMILFFMGCDSSKQPDTSNVTSETIKNYFTPKPDKGIGKFSKMELTHPLDEDMVKKGQGIYDARCISCHKLTDEKLVGPGWKGVTDRRTPEWIMNFITNTDVMLDSDLIAQQLVVICIARMPNQNLNDAEARSVLESMRKNDGKN